VMTSVMLPHVVVLAVAARAIFSNSRFLSARSVCGHRQVHQQTHAVGTRTLTAGRIRCVVFDLDDTLWSTAETLSEAYAAMHAELVLHCPDIARRYTDASAFWKEMRITMDANPAKAHDYTFVRRASLQRITGSDSITDKVFKAWFEKRNCPVFFPGALEALRLLQESGLKLGTLTDGNADALAIDGLGDLLDFCVTAREAGTAKPAARPFELCEEKAGCSPAEMVMVGDSVEKDVEGAIQAGWQAIWVRPPSSGPSLRGSAFDMAQTPASSGEGRADAVVDHVRDVVPILHAWTAKPLGDPGEGALERTR